MSVSIILENPKYIENLGGVIRAVACFGGERVLWTGTRLPWKLNKYEQNKIKKTSGGHGKVRIPREFRMKDYQAIDYHPSEKPFDELMGISNYPPIVPVCIEVDGGEDLTWFSHPSNAVYVFGPEDGSVGQVFRKHCHRFVRIPTKFCINLAAAVNVVLADRVMKQQRKETT